jgi:NitT/TauT family transport system substrate-binding protein
MISMTRRTCLAGLSSLPLASCSRRRRPTTEVRVVCMPYFNMASLYLADESGYFADAGLRIQIQELDRSQVAIPLLAAGEADVAFFGISPSLINSVVRGARVRIVAGRYRYSSTCPDERRLYGSRHAFPAGFTDLRQMKGKKASAGRVSAGLGLFLWTQFLDAAGLTSADVPTIDLDDYEAAAALLATNRIDILLPSVEHDIVLTSLRDYVVPGPSVSGILPNFVYSYIIFGKRFLDGSPGDGSRFLNAYFHGSRDFRRGKTPKFIDRLIQRDRLNPEAVRKMCRDGLLTDGHIPLNDLQRFIDWSKGQSTSPSGVRAEQLVDMRFLQEAHLG